MQIPQAQRGQVLIAVIFVMLIAFGAGLIISHRLITSVPRATNLDTGNRALAAAETGIEKALSYSTTAIDGYIQNNNCATACTITITSTDGLVSTADISFEYAGSSLNDLEIKINKNETYEINMNGYLSGKPIQLCWDDSANGNNPSLYISYVYYSSGYKVNKYAYNSATTSHLTNGFSASSADLTYPNCATLPYSDSPRFIRVMALYDNVTLHIIPKEGATLPIQGYMITSIGKVGNVTKKLKVLRTKPYLPSSFDFALFNTSETSVLSN